MQSRAGHARGWNLERWLRSPARRWTLALGLLALAALATTTQISEFGRFGRRGPGSERIEPDWSDIFVDQLAYWLAWGVVGFLAFALARWTLARLRSWLLFALVQIPLSLAVAAGFTALYVQQVSRTFDRPSRRPRTFIDSFERLGPWRMPREFVIYWVLLGVGGAVHTFLTGREQERRASGLQLRAVKLEGDLARAQVESLRSQLHPHFLFNALHTVGGLVREGADDAALSTLSSIGDLLRMTLDQGESQLVPLREELRIAGRYLEIERIRFGDRLTVEWTIEEGNDDFLVPALVLLPLVENAVRHAVEPRPQPSVVRVSCRREGARLWLEVQDDGPGFSDAALDLVRGGGNSGERRHIGLWNTRERLSALYGDAHELRLENAPGGGARVSVRLPPRAPELGGDDDG